MPLDPRLNPYVVPPSRPPQRRRTLLALLLVPIAGAMATSLILTTTAGAEQVDTAGVIQAEAWSAQSGAHTENTEDVGGGRDVGGLADGDWMRYDDVDLGGPGSLTASVRIATAGRTGGTIELRAGARDGELLAALPVGYTGGWQTWTTRTTVSRTARTGPQTVFLVLRSAHGGDFVNINWLRFTRTPTATVPGPYPPSRSSWPTP